MAMVTLAAALAANNNNPAAALQQQADNNNPQPEVQQLTSNASSASVTYQLAKGAPKANKGVWGITHDAIVAAGGKATGNQLLAAFSGMQKPRGGVYTTGYVLQHLRHRTRKGHLVTS